MKYKMAKDVQLGDFLLLRGRRWKVTRTVHNAFWRVEMAAQCAEWPVVPRVQLNCFGFWPLRMARRTERLRPGDEITVDGQLRIVVEAGQSGSAAIVVHRDPHTYPDPNPSILLYEGQG